MTESSWKILKLDWKTPRRLLDFFFFQKSVTLFKGGNWEHIQGVGATAVVAVNSDDSEKGGKEKWERDLQHPPPCVVPTSVLALVAPIHLSSSNCPLHSVTDLHTVITIFSNMLDENSFLYLCVVSGSFSCIRCTSIIS